MNASNGIIDSQSGHFSSQESGAPGSGKQKMNKKHSHLHQPLAWSSFCKAAFEHNEMEIGEIYFAKEGKNTKKLKFLKCWMKQIKKSSCSIIIPDGSQLHQDIPKETQERLTVLHQESERPISLSVSAQEDVLTGASRIQDEAALDFCSETSEAFFSVLSGKIQEGIESEGVDLGALAERLVSSSIHWLHQKFEMETSESQNAEQKVDDPYGSKAVVELIKLLVKEPKDLAAKHKNNDPPCESSDPRSTRLTSEKIVREYQLQILFRMEILCSGVTQSIEESTKQKFVKQICLLLETIQCHMEGGFFGDWSLDNYVGKIIKSRYSHTLGDIVHKIYTRMDLLLFGDEDESPNPLLNSEDSNQSWREKPDRDEIGDSERANELISAENESSQPLEDDNGSPTGNKGEEHARRLIEARERRERARRFASFTSWVPDLQRVWAPKQPNAMKPKSDSYRKQSKRKDRRRASYDMVCETPMSSKKRSLPRSSSDDNDPQDHGLTPAQSQKLCFRMTGDNHCLRQPHQWLLAHSFS
ncbi:hypothetical protein CK203_030885 [Vitis vinifera]|uniref:Uncharacterized protein n=1 Tax=Vitis vinifera TaxID=29760 RepID=A0A438ICW5_VITVI|nr:hypothetical protein CK203_030885 [Vitis vinifera]